jgi:hypothetical protein
LALKVKVSPIRNKMRREVKIHLKNNKTIFNILVLKKHRKTTAEYHGDRLRVTGNSGMIQGR